MRPCSAALAAYLPNNDTAVIADLYVFTLPTGEILRYSGWTTALNLPGTAFPPGSINTSDDIATFVLGPRFGRSKVTTKNGVEPTELDIEIFAGPTDLVGTFAFAEAVRLGLFDGASVELDRFFAPPPANGSGALDPTLGAIVWFYGRVAECDVGRSSITMKVKSLMSLIAIQQMPRRLYGAGCTHVFGDAMCGYDRVAGRNAVGGSTGIGAVSITARPGSTQAAIVTGFTPSPSSAYDEGTITATSGANTGASRTVAAFAADTVQLLKPFLSPVTPGDAFQLLPGCDHTVVTCNSTLNNLLRYGGFPYIPPPEAAA